MKIALITGSRAEWGLLKPLAQKLHNTLIRNFHLVVTGSHLSPQFGMTVNEIPAEWITDKVECILASDTPVAISKAMGLAVISFGETYERLEPDLVVVLGDRFEILAAVIAAHISRIPVCHIHGGEVTAGAYDDAFRHSITKMSQLHFVAAEPYKIRLMQLGEHPDNVFNVGALGCDGLEKRDEKKARKNLILVCLHEETIDVSLFGWKLYADIAPFLKKMISGSNYRAIYIHAGADVGTMVFGTRDKEKGCDHFESLPRTVFLDFLRKSVCIIGNSSSGIIEAPALGVPTINIGDRQKGRPMADSIIQAEPTKESIQAAFDKLYSQKFQDLMKTDYYQPYKGENVAEKIVAIIRERLPNINMKKGFYDLPRFQ